MNDVESEVRVRYADTDKMGYAYHANFLVWLEVGRTEWLRARGLCYVDVEAGGCILPVVSVTVRYLRPARYDDVLRIRTRLAEGRKASLSFAYEVRRGEEILAQGSTQHACAGPDGRVIRMPQALRDVIAEALAPGEGAA
ncbi:MAG: thioesterase family protein [Acidobacteriota bacterium]